MCCDIDGSRTHLLKHKNIGSAHFQVIVLYTPTHIQINLDTRHTIL